MTQSETKYQDFDVLSLENRLQEDFEVKQLTEKFCQNYKENSKTTFIDGEYDCYLDIEPESYQWLSCDNQYRSGYLCGVAQRFDEQFSPNC